jgi:hypothetical protein
MKADHLGYLPLYTLLENRSSTIDLALMMIEKYPASLQHRSVGSYLPLYVECFSQCRAFLILTLLEMNPEPLDAKMIDAILNRAHKSDFHRYVPLLSIIFSTHPMKLYDAQSIIRSNDIRLDPYYRRRILKLLPRHINITDLPTHNADFRQLNWKPRAAMMMLLSQIKIQHGPNIAAALVGSSLAQ